MPDATSSCRNTSILLSSHVRLDTWQVFYPPATELGLTSERPVAVTQRSSACYRHWPFRCCSSPFTYRGTHRGPFYGIPPTGRPIEMRSIDIWRVQDGEFTEHWDELNLLELFQQLGVIPALDLAAPQATS
jgi:SnoaL-like polyketide cyclase